jgi:anti-anti-sigma factor
MEEQNVNITIEPAPSVPNLKIVTIKGTIDKVTSAQVNAKVLPIIEKEDSNIIIDLSNLDFLSSVGMMDLAKYLVLLTDRKRFLKLIKPSKPVYDTMAKMGFEKRFDIYDSVEAAISSS